jgi:hypothetical protein
MTQLLFQRFSQTIGCCARLNRWLSYCCGAHWSFYLFLKLLRSDISEKLEILYTVGLDTIGMILAFFGQLAKAFGVNSQLQKTFLRI